MNFNFQMDFYYRKCKWRIKMHFNCKVLNKSRMHYHRRQKKKKENKPRMTEYSEKGKISP